MSLLPSSVVEPQSLSEWHPVEPLGPPLGFLQQAALEGAWLELKGEVVEDRKLEVGVAQKQEEK